MGRISLAAAAAFLTASSSALQLRDLPGASTGPGYVSIPVAHKRDENFLQRRDASNVDLTNYEAVFTIDGMYWFCLPLTISITTSKEKHSSPFFSRSSDTRRVL
jgi:hypothetical protein